MSETKYIDEIIILSSGNITLVEKIENKNVNGVIISTAYSRRTINVGDDLTMEDPRVQAIGAVVHSESYLGIPIIPIDNSNWDTFNTQMLSDSRFNRVSIQCFSIAPMVASSVPTALLQVSTHGLNSFSSVWANFCTIGGATAEDKQVWGGFAEANNLPPDFIAILVGNTSI